MHNRMLRAAEADLGEELLHHLAGDPHDPEVIAALDEAAGLAELMRRLKYFRERHELTQKVVADRMGTTQSAVSNLERTAGDPRIHTIQRYARAVNASLRWIVVSNNGDWDHAPKMKTRMRVARKSRSGVRKLRTFEVVLSNEDSGDGNRVA